MIHMADCQALKRKRAAAAYGLLKTESVENLRLERIYLYGKSFRYRFGDHQFLHVCDGRWRPGSFRKFRRSAHHAFGRGVYKKWRTPRRPGCEASSGHESAEHSFF